MLEAHKQFVLSEAKLVLLRMGYAERFAHQLQEQICRMLQQDLQLYLAEAKAEVQRDISNAVLQQQQQRAVRPGMSAMPEDLSAQQQQQHCLIMLLTCMQMLPRHAAALHMPTLASALLLHHTQM